MAWNTLKCFFRLTNIAEWNESIRTSYTGRPSYRFVFFCYSTLKKKQNINLYTIYIYLHWYIIVNLILLLHAALLCYLRQSTKKHIWYTCKLKNILAKIGNLFDVSVYLCILIETCLGFLNSDTSFLRFWTMIYILFHWDIKSFLIFSNAVGNLRFSEKNTWFWYEI